MTDVVTTILTGLGTLLIAVGMFFLVVASIGFIRLPDVYCRLHVTGVIDTLGAPLLLLGAAAYLVPDLVSAKLVLAVVFLFATSPLVGHLLCRAALRAGPSAAPPCVEGTLHLDLQKQGTEPPVRLPERQPIPDSRAQEEP